MTQVVQKTVCYLLSLMMLFILFSGAETAKAAGTVASGSCGTNLTWVLTDDGTLTISGTGEMDNWDVFQAPWYNYGLYHRIKRLVFENDVSTIGNYAFQSCESLTSFEIPSSVTSIGSNAFSSCQSLESITIPSSVTSIGSKAFSSCQSLESITIPSSVTSIGVGVFQNCSTLIEIRISSENHNYCDVDGVLFNKEMTLLHTFPAGKTEVCYSIPSSVTSIESTAFGFCSNLISVTIPTSVTSIGSSAFRGCTSLANIVIPSSVTNIGSSVFRECTSLANIVIPSSVTSIEDYAFYKCGSLTCISIPSSVTSIGDYVFDSCTSLESITIPDSVTSIGDSTFSSCTSLVSISIPSSVTSIGDEAFNNCTSLESITIPDSVTSIGDHAFSSCTSLTSIVIPSSVTSIGYGVFYSCYWLKSITILSSVTSLGMYFFYNCGNLAEIAIPDSVTSIGNFAFYGCRRLTEIAIPDGVTIIAEDTFFGCTKLTSITIPDSVTSIGKSAFYDCTALSDVYYTGSQKQWNDIKIGNNNTPLRNATIHFNAIIQYTITFDANGGSNEPEPQTKMYGQPLMMSDVRPVYGDYLFLGWAENASAEIAQYQPGGSFTKNANTTLYAVWMSKTHMVEYNANGGSGAPDAQSKTYGEALTLSTTKPIYDGYTFLGWAESAAATSAQYQPGGSFTKDANTTLYAVWKSNTYTVEYNANGGSRAPSAQTKKYGQTLTLSTTEPVYDGYTFLGWSESASATSAQYQPGGSFTADVDTTLYAVWKINTYTVEYNANGGTGALSAQTKTHGQTLTLSTDEPVYDGYTFLGWAESAAATSAQYQPGSSFTTDANTTLYAVWTINTYTVEYNANGGSGAPDAQTKTHGEDLTLSTDEPVYDGYTFLGWAESAAATSVQYQPGGSFTKDADTTLYAVWKINTYTVEYNANGGSGTPSAQTKTHGEALTLSTEEPVYDGYTFLGWAESAGATSAQYQPGDSFMKNANTTLYAVWKINTYTVEFNANGGSGAPDAQTKTHGEDLTLSTDEPVFDSYTFLGWAENASATSAQYQPGSSFTTDANTTLYAVWTINTYTVEYNANGGSGAPDAQTKTHGEDLTLSTDEPVFDGYTFLGWAESASTENAQYQPGDNFTKDADTTLYAVWKINTYTIEFNANGGSGAPDAQTKTHGEDLTLSTDEPVFGGYTFLGWAESVSTEIAQYQPGDKFTKDANTTLYAVWKINTYTVEFNANGGTGAPDAQTKLHGEDLTLRTTEPTYEGYSFLGWAESAAAESVQYQPGDSFTKDADTTLYAVWKAKTYSVTYNANGGFGAPDTQTKTHGEDLTLSTDEPIFDGYTFLGWAESASAEVTQYQPGGSFITDANTTLYAVWKINTYTVEYNANGGSGAPSAQTKTHGEELTLRTTKPVYDGYTFLGWAESASAESAQYQPGDSFNIDADTTLYAVWKKAALPGDVDGNGQVNTTDVILVRRYIAGGYNVTIDENAADVDGNGVINTTDVILMRRFIAGGYGVVLKPGNIS